MPPLSFQAPPPRRLAVRRHFKPKGPTALSPHSGSRAVSQFAALVESATMHSFAAHSLRRSPDGSLAAVTVCLPITWPVPLKTEFKRAAFPDRALRQTSFGKPGQL